jgi:hypothetical protein
MAEDDDDDGERARDTSGEAHCAGALIMLERLGQPSQMMRIGERLGLYDRTGLDMEAPVFESFGAMRGAMAGTQRSRRQRVR